LGIDNAALGAEVGFVRTLHSVLKRRFYTVLRAFANVLRR
jgi:hypothetical protein